MTRRARFPRSTLATCPICHEVWTWPLAARTCGCRWRAPLRRLYLLDGGVAVMSHHPAPLRLDVSAVMVVVVYGITMRDEAPGAGWGTRPRHVRTTRAWCLRCGACVDGTSEREALLGLAAPSGCRCGTEALERSRGGGGAQ